MIIFFASICLSFLIGFFIQKGNICAVAAVRHLVVSGDSSHLQAFYVAGCGAGLTLLVLQWLLPNHVNFSDDFEVTLFTVLGGVTFGFGAWINNACILGTAAHFCKGDINYSATFTGIFIGATLANQQFILFAKPIKLVFDASTSFTVLLASLYSFTMVLAITKSSQKKGDSCAFSKIYDERLFITTGIGVACAALHAFNGEWSYLASLVYLSDCTGQGASSVLLSHIYPLSLVTFLGATFAVFLSRQFMIHRLVPTEFGLKFFGGFAMGIAVRWIPGGNESMMFFGAPSFASQALVAYGAMLLTITALTKLKHRSVI